MITMRADICDLVGVTNGIETKLGTMPITPKQKAKDIVSSYFNGELEDEMGGDATYAYSACVELVDWMIKQGWAITPEAMLNKVLTKGEYD